MSQYEFDRNLPIYIQIMDEIKKDIFSGKLKVGDKIPSVREYAVQFGVNPNTIQKALTELERAGLLRSERAVGRFVSDNQSAINAAQKQLCEDIVKNYVSTMKAMGCNDEMIICMVRDFLKTERL